MAGGQIADYQGLVHSGQGNPMARIDELRLMARIARLYYEKDKSQAHIADQLGISQASVSRLLNRAKEEGVVRISVSVPTGVYSELEEALIDTYHLRDAIIIDTVRNDDESLVMMELGSAAAYYVESSIKPNEVIGLSSWSTTLLRLVDSMHSVPRKSGVKVVQILGGVGNPAAEVYSNRMADRLANLLRGAAIPLPAPGIVGSPATLEVLLQDAYVRTAIDLFDSVTMALVGIGSLEPSPLLAQSGNIFSEEELEMLRSNGAVGDILLHFFDKEGNPVDTFLNNRVVSMDLPQLSMVEKAIGVAGGDRKFEAIRGALRGGWLNVLVTDQCTANRLLEAP